MSLRSATMPGRAAPFPGDTNRVHRSFPDPPFLAKSIEGEEEKMVPYREVRDMIKDFILTFPEGLKDEE